jgi:hypothetical protein
MRLLTRAAITLSITACVTAGLAPSAYAEKVVHVDATADVVSIGWDEQTGAEATVPAPEQRNGDLLRTVVQHRLRRIILTASYAELRRVAPTTHFVSLVTNESIRRHLEIVATAAHPQGRILFSSRFGRTVTCSGLERHIDYLANTLRVVIPRSCLSAPRWVRAGFGTVRNLTTDLGMRTLVDDANLEGAVGSAHPTFGARVLRG